MNATRPLPISPKFLVIFNQWPRPYIMAKLLSRLAREVCASAASSLTSPNCISLREHATSTARSRAPKFRSHLERGMSDRILSEENENRSISSSSRITEITEDDGFLRLDFPSVIIFFLSRLAQEYRGACEIS